MVTSLKAQLPSYTVESCVVPYYRREELTEPIICICLNGREFEIEMGPDQRDVIIGVGIAGAVGSVEGYGKTREARLKKLVAETDALDGIVEQIVAMFSPNGTLSEMDMAEHVLQNISQPVFVDAPTYQEKGVWLTVLLLTFRDSEDQ